MDTIQLIQLFKWMTIINIGIFLVSSILIMLLKNIVKKMHAKLFGIEMKEVLVTIYAYLGLYKIMIIVFNLVPYAALLIIE